MRAVGRFCALIALIALLGACSQAPVETGAKAYLLIDMSTGKVLAATRENHRYAAGSLNKLMVCLLLFEEINAGDVQLTDQVVVSDAAAQKKGSVAGLEAGDVITIDQLLYCVLLPSGNDAVTALAEHLAGTAEAMVLQMNAKAHALGMADTAYTDVTGIDGHTQYMSCRDLATLAAAVLETYPDIRQYTATREYDVVLASGRVLSLGTTNALLGQFEGVDGFKTGSTAAGYNAIITAERTHARLMVVVMGSPTSAKRFDLCARLLGRAFAEAGDRVG